MRQPCRNQQKMAMSIWFVAACSEASNYPSFINRSGGREPSLAILDHLIRSHSHHDHFSNLSLI